MFWMIIPLIMNNIYKLSVDIEALLGLISKVLDLCTYDNIISFACTPVWEWDVGAGDVELHFGFYNGFISFDRL